VLGPRGLVAPALQGAHQARLVHRVLFERLAARPDTMAATSQLDEIISRATVRQGMA